jgi:flagellar biosynthesis/type III secretory pathway protein FliH
VRLVAAEVADAAVRAKRILADANARAAERLSQVEEDLATTRADLMTRVRADAGLALATETVKLVALRGRNIKRARDDIIALAQMMAERIIGEELTWKPGRLLNLAQQCMREARGSSCVVIHAHPNDAAYLSRHVEDFHMDPAIDVRIQSEAELSPGDLRIETDVGTVDARIGTQLEHLAAKLRESYGV